MTPEEDRLNIAEVINHLEELVRDANDAAEIFDYTRQIVKWRKKLLELGAGDKSSLP
jgi:hypothetical protein